jgi:hypothetical protein
MTRLAASVREREMAVNLPISSSVSANSGGHRRSHVAQPDKADFALQRQAAV